VDRLELARPRFDIPDRDALNDVVLRTDPTSLVNLIQSLANNAFTHGAKNVGVTTSVDLPFQPMLEVGVRPESPVYVSIHDDGPGIDIGFLPRAFEKFEKQSRSSGTGLGLYIARLMTDALSGSILVTTSENGTNVAVALPAGKSKGVAA
ncbi:MAG: ATP-binding protein, partial [Acidimicrobiia bacterium]|nr:ATP-binding protein [Acidimicrobiia bacterium]